MKKIIEGIKESIVNWIIDNVLVEHDFVDYDKMDERVDKAVDDISSSLASRDDVENLEYDIEQISDRTDTLEYTSEQNEDKVNKLKLDVFDLEQRVLKLEKIASKADQKKDSGVGVPSSENTNDDLWLILYADGTFMTWRAGKPKSTDHILGKTRAFKVDPNTTLAQVSLWISKSYTDADWAEELVEW